MSTMDKQLTPTTTKLYTVAQVAEMLGVSQLRVYQLREARSAGVQMGKRWLFSAEDVERMRPDSRFKRKDYANPPARKSLASRIRLTKLRRGVWYATEEGVTYVAKEVDQDDEDPYRFHLYVRNADGSLTLHVAMDKRDDLLDAMRALNPDLRSWRLYS